MRNTYFRLLFLCVCSATAQSLFSQDRIYFQNDTKDAKVVDITSDQIQFKDPRRTGAVVSVPRNKVLLIFNSTGHFLVVPQLPNDKEQSQFIIKNFINDATVAQTDKLITLQNDVINCKLENEERKTVKFTTAAGEKQIRKSDLAVIIYKDGRHKVIPDVKKVLDPLGAVQSKLVMSRPKAPAVTPVTVPATVMATATKTTIPVADTTMARITTNTATGMVKSTGTHTGANSIGETGVTDKKDKQPVDALGEVSFEEYERKALAKTNDLKVYIQQLCDKALEWTDANKFIDQAVNLFISENAKVETSTVNSTAVSRYRIREYLRRIKLIQYDKVEIEWTNVQYVSKLRKGPDGNYYGIITFEQTFKGYSGDNQLQYSDVTRKNIEVVLKTYNRNVEGKSVPTWDVFLSEIKVISTKA